jgi:hypothetical protein
MKRLSHPRAGFRYFGQGLVIPSRPLAPYSGRQDGLKALEAHLPSHRITAWSRADAGAQSEPNPYCGN